MNAIKLTLPALYCYICWLTQAKNIRNASIGKRCVHFASIIVYYLRVQLDPKLLFQLMLVETLI